MKTTIQIKSILGKILFEYEKADNSIKDTLIEAVKSGAYLYGADLSGADLSGAYLSGAYLSGANLYGAYLSGAYLSGAYLSGANLYGAYLSGAYLSGIKIKKAIAFTGLYKYIVIPIIAEDDKKYVKMGCYTRTVEEWDNDFWNNNKEFPNDGSKESKLRLFAYNTAKEWFKIIES